jgi:hypothetical protein
MFELLRLFRRKASSDSPTHEAEKATKQFEKLFLLHGERPNKGI